MRGSCTTIPRIHLHKETAVHKPITVECRYRLVTKAVSTNDGLWLLNTRWITHSLNSSRKYTFRLPGFQIDHLVIGGGMSRTWLSHSSLCSYHHLISGVVGLSVARQLVLRHFEKTTYLVERHNRAGEELRWTPGTQSMGSGLIRLLLAPVTRK